MIFLSSSSFFPLEKYTEHRTRKSLFSLGPFYALGSILLEIPSLKGMGLIGKTSLNAKLFTWCDDAEEDLLPSLYLPVNSEVQKTSHISVIACLGVCVSCVCQENWVRSHILLGLSLLYWPQQLMFWQLNKIPNRISHPLHLQQYFCGNLS